MGFDEFLFQAINGLSHKLTVIDFLAIFFAEYLPYFLIVAFFLWLVFERRWQLKFYKFSLAAIAIIISRGILVEAIRFFYYRPRPELVISIEPLIATPSLSSFPSGHAAVFFALAMAVFFVNRKNGWWFIVLAALVALARVFAGVHWFSDVVAGALLGIISAFFAKRFLPPKSAF